MPHLRVRGIVPRVLRDPADLAPGCNGTRGTMPADCRHRAGDPPPTHPPAAVRDQNRTELAGRTYSFCRDVLASYQVTCSPPASADMVPVSWLRCLPPSLPTSRAPCAGILLALALRPLHASAEKSLSALFFYLTSNRFRCTQITHFYGKEWWEASTLARHGRDFASVLPPSPTPRPQFGSTSPRAETMSLWRACGAAV